MKIKIVLLGVAVVLVIALAAGGIWWMMRPQVIVFSDDSKVTLLGVDYGKKHAAPGVKAPTTSTNRTPARGGRNSFTTTNDMLVLWVRQEYDSKQYHNFQFFIYDKAGTACVSGYGYGGGNNRGNEVVGVRVDAFPRRQGKFLVGIMENGNGGQEMSEKKFVISNPARKSFSKWTAEPVPTIKTDDDLAVTLNKLVYGAPNVYTRNEVDADDAMNKAVQATFHIERDGKPVTNWQPVTITTTDATGNQVSGYANRNEWQNGDDVVTYQYGLWPDETAWKTRLEFSQQSDFAASELWNVQDVPVVPGKQQEMYNYNPRRANTNSVYAEKDMNGFHLKLFPAKDFTDAGNNNWMQGGLFIQVNPDLSEGWRMTVKVTDNQNNEVQSSDYGNSRNNNVSNYRYRLQDVAGLTNLNVSVALHKSRFVEFTAKPEKAPASADTANP
jgi:hypothetical protein